MSKVRLNAPAPDPDYATNKNQVNYLETFGIALASGTQEAVIEVLLSYGRRTAFFMSARAYRTIKVDREYRQIIRRFNFLLPSTTFNFFPINRTLYKRGLTQVELLPKLLKEAAKMEKRVFLIGGKYGVSKAAAKQLQHDISGLNIVGTSDGSVEDSETEITLSDIQKSGADIVLVDLGGTAQEVWIDRYGYRFSANLIIAAPGFLKQRLRSATKPRGQIFKTVLRTLRGFINGLRFHSLRHRGQI